MSYQYGNQQYGQGNQQGAVGYNQPYQPQPQAYEMAHKNTCGISTILIVDIIILLGLVGSYGSGVSNNIYMLIPTLIWLALLIWAIWCLVVECRSTRDESSHRTLTTYGQARVCLMWFYAVIAVIVGIIAVIILVLVLKNPTSSGDSQAAMTGLVIVVFIIFFFYLLNVIWFCCTKDPYFNGVNQEHAGHLMSNNPWELK